MLSQQLTIVAFGTSAPEFVVNIQAILGNFDDIAVGNIIGSNISNSFLILGSTAIFSSILFTNKSLNLDISFLLIITAAFITICFVFKEVNLYSGLGLTFILLYYSNLKFNQVKKNKKLLDPELTEPVADSTLKLVSIIILGMAMLVVGGKITVDGAIGIAKLLNISEAVISATIIALGSSLPELAACVAAAKKKQTEIAITNVVGSNIFNIVLGLGFIAFFQPIEISSKFLNFDLYFLSLSIFILAIIAFITKKLVRNVAILFILIYLTFIFLQYYGQ